MKIDTKMYRRYSYSYHAIILTLICISFGYIEALSSDNEVNNVSPSNIIDNVLASVSLIVNNSNENHAPSETTINIASIQSPITQTILPTTMTGLDITSKSAHLEHEYLGIFGPNKHERDGILRALDWLAEKRSADYGWQNDTHMVILAKEVINYPIFFLK